MLLEKCIELNRMKKELVPIFILISEREKRIHRDIDNLIFSPIISEAQQKYLENLVQNLGGITKKLTIKLNSFLDDHKNFSDNFIINNEVFLFLIKSIGLYRKM